MMDVHGDLDNENKCPGFLCMAGDNFFGTSRLGSTLKLKQKIKTIGELIVLGTYFYKL